MACSHFFIAQWAKRIEPGRSERATISARADPSALSFCHAINTPVSWSEKAMDSKLFFGFSNIHAAWHIDCPDYLSREGKA
jgi:hypothetical protein